MRDRCESCGRELYLTHCPFEWCAAKENSMGWVAMMSDDHGANFARNSLVFGSEEEAKWYADDLAMRWLAVTDWHVDEVDEPVTDAMVRSTYGTLIHFTVAPGKGGVTAGAISIPRKPREDFFVAT